MKPLSTKQDAQTVLTVDEFLQQVGSWGRFQMLVTFIASLLFIIPAHQALLMVFIAVSPPWVCSGRNPVECNSTKVFYEGDFNFNLRCGMQRSSWEYRIGKPSYSLVSEFDLVCTREWLSYLSSSTLFIGIGIGGVVLGWASDQYGRKKILYGSYLMECIVAFSISFSPNIYVFIGLRVIAGIFHGGVLLSNIVVSVELVGPKHRVLAGLIIFETWGVAMCFLSLQSYYIPDWRDLSKILSAPYIVVMFGALFVPESLRWHCSQNNWKEAEKILQKVARINKQTYPSHASLEPVKITDAEKSGSFRNLFTSWKATLRMFYICFMWFTCECLYYGLALTFSGFGGSLHRDFVLLTAAELIANIVIISIVNRLGRKKSTVAGLGVAAVGLVLTGVLSLANVKVNGLNIVIGITIKVFTLMSWCAVEIWSTELFPTCVRSKAIGIFFVTSQLGSALSPWIAKGLLQFHATLPFFVLGILPFICLVFALLLPETMGKSMDDTMDDVMSAKIKDQESTVNKKQETTKI